MECWGHYSSHDIAVPVERQRLADDPRISAEPTPERVRNHHLILALEPPANNRIDTELINQRRRDRDPLDVLRLSGEYQVLASLAEPTESVEDPIPFLIGLCIFVRK